MLYGKLRPYLNKVATPDFAGRCTTELVPLLPDKSVDRDWLAWYLRRPETVDFAMRGKTGSRMPRANMREFMGMEIPIPPLAEQRRVVARLNARMAVVERAKAAAREILDAADALNAAIVRELMPSIGHQLADFWKWAKLGEVSEIVYGYTARANPNALGPKYLRITDIQDGAVDWSRVPSCEISRRDEEKKSLRHGDIVVARTGSTGKSFLVRQPPRSVLASYLLRVRVNDSVSPEYLAYFFNTDSYWQHISSASRGSVQANVNAKILGNMPIPIPPLAEQRRIAALIDERLAASARIAAAARGGLDEIEAMPSALLRRALGDGG